MNILDTPQTDSHAMASVADGAPASMFGTAAAAPRLTPRQSQVLGLLCEGLPDKLIARRLDVSHHTVRGHVQILYSVLQVSNRMQAMFAARQRGLIN